MSKNLEEVLSLYSYYRKDHILSRNKNLAEWMFKFEESYTVASLYRSEQLVAMFGYIRSDSKFGGSGIPLTIYGAGWAGSDDAPGAAMILLQSTLRELKANFVAIGLSEVAVRLYQERNYQIGQFRNFHLAINSSAGSSFGCKNIVEIDKTGLQELDILDVEKCPKHFFEELFAKYPSRSSHFLTNRYSQSPSFDYHQRVISVHGIPISYISYRWVVTTKGPIMRVLDLLIWPKRKISDVQASIHKLLSENSDAILDYRMAGQDSLVLSQILCDESCSAVIPHLVSPLVWEPSVLLFAANFEPTYLSRADGDQDREN